MPTAAMHNMFWADQGAAPVGPKMQAMRIIGPPLMALLALALEGFLGL